MPTYDYECSNCGHKIVDFYQSINSEAITYCNECKQNTLERLIFSPYIAVKGEAKTIGQLAERNSNKFGKSQVEDKINKDKESKQQALKEAKKEIRSKINSMSETQKRRYIEDGKV
ncbi:MAG: Zinc ribbon domain [Bacteroidota bacterium]|jgi:putative FmdB family regulatory protein